MGVFLSMAYSKLFPMKNTRILMIGLDAAGKTTMLYKMKLNESINTAPTIGFNVETIEYNNLKMTIWDIGGQDFLRKLWHHYFENNQGLVFVVDSSDNERLGKVKEIIEQLLSEEQLTNVPILVFGNKQDLANLNSTQIIERLGLLNIKGHNWYYQPSCALTGDGIFDGFNWLAKEIKNDKSKR